MADTRVPPDRSGGNPLLHEITGIERCSIKVKPDRDLAAVELTVTAADGSARCLLGYREAIHLAAALLTAASALQEDRP
jgi:hypothetical protein